MKNILENSKLASQYIKNKINLNPEIAIILGSGLGSFTDNIEEKIEIEYKEIPSFPVSTVEGHSGKLVIGKVKGKAVIVMSGRFHYYEGYSMEEITFPIRVLHLLGIKQIIITNAAGGIGDFLEAGDLMVIRDHIKIALDSPLRGKNIEEFGTRFPDMRNCYNEDLLKMVKQTGQELGIDIKEGVYFFMPGPQFETASEVNLIKICGGDAVRNVNSTRSYSV